MGFFHILRSVALVSGIVGSINLAVSFSFSFLMEKTDYGIYTYWLSIYLLFVNLIPFGAVAAATLFRFNVSWESYRRTLYSSLIFILPVMLLISISLFYIKSQVLRVDIGIEIWAPISACFYGYCLILLAIYRVEQKFTNYAKFFISIVSLISMLQLLAYTIFKDVSFVIYGYVAGAFFAGIVALVTLVRMLEFEVIDFKKSFKNTYSSILYGLPIVLGSVMMSFMVVGDKIIIKEYITAHQMGMYSSVSIVCSTTLFLVNNLAAAWSGFLSKKLANIDMLNSKLFFHSCQIKILPLSLLISISISLFLSFLCFFLYNISDFTYIYSAFLLSMGYCAYAVSKFYVGFLMFYNFNTYVLKSSFFGVLALFAVSNIKLGDPILRVALAVLLSFIAQLLYLFLITNRKVYRGAHAI